MRVDVAPLARTMSRVAWVRIVFATGLLALTTVAITWPLFRHPASTVLDTESLYGPASVLVQRDINLNIWTLAWDSHALVTDPLHLFHANAFYPARHTLALLQRSGVLPDYEKSNFTSLAFLTMLRFGLSGVLRFYVVPSKESIPVFLTYTAMTL